MVLSIIAIFQKQPAPSTSPPNPNASRKRAFDSNPDNTTRHVVTTPFIEPIVESPPIVTPEPIYIHNEDQELRLDQSLNEGEEICDESNPPPPPSSRRSRMRKAPPKTPRTPRTARNTRPPSRAEMAERREDIFGEGTITKKPTENLHEIAKYADLVVDNPLFTYNDGEEKPPTRPRTTGKRTSTAKDSSIEKWKISNHSKLLNFYLISMIPKLDMNF